MTDIIKGYKAFNTSDGGGLCCRDMTYEVGKSYALDGKPELCERGYHFCRRLVDCYGWYERDSRICDVEADGTIIDGADGKSVTDHIRIVRELDRHEVLDMANVGKGCTGICNSGDWNNTNFSAGVLCTQEPECLIFDKPSGMTLREWRDTDAAYLMDGISIDTDRWIFADDMTDEEKAAHHGFATTDGYLRRGTGKPDFAGWWKSLNDYEMAVILAIPNFDPEKWKLITGIEVR